LVLQFYDHVSIEPFYAKYNHDPNIKLYVREVVAEDAIESAASTGKIIVLIHGATFPSSVAFDLDYENASMMQQLARSGWDTFALDMEGYGNSPRPAVMDDPDKFPDDPAPISPDVTVANVASVVDFVRELRGVDKVHVLGWSAGAMIEAPRYAIEQPDKVEKLVLWGTRYKGKALNEDEIAKKIDDINSKKNRMGDPSSIERWGSLGTAPNMIKPGLFKAYTIAHKASDPMSDALDGKIRAPFGRFMEVSTQETRVDAEKITVPTLIIRGELDTVVPLEDNTALLNALAGDGNKLVTIPGAGHFNQMEKTNKQFYQALENFLNN